MTGGSFDALNNTEQVHLAAPPPGVFTIRVRGTSVVAPAADPHQGYALVATGDLVSPVPAVYMTPGGELPAFVSPGTATDVAVLIQSGAQTPVAGSARLYYRVDGRGFSSVTLTPSGGNLYHASLPAANCGQLIEYYFAVDGAGGATQTLPAGAPASLFSARVRTERLVLSDDFSQDSGWSVTGNPADGAFERGVAQLVMQCNRTAQPAGDHTGGACVGVFGTHLSAGADADTGDLDGPGATRLESPAMNLSAFEAAELSAWVWFYDGYVNDDVVTVEATSDGSTWMPVATLRTGTTTWQYVRVRLDPSVSLTSQVRVRFVAEDVGRDSTMEVLVDDVVVRAWGCGLPPACVKGDINGNGAVDGDDIAPFIELLNAACPDSAPLSMRCAGDFDGDNRVTSADVAGFAACLLGVGCP